jgi:tRNA 2-thiouridine synthesizing protein A
MTEILPDRTYDAIGLMCPMPLVNARKEIMQMDVGQILKIVATDRGSVKDFQGWARTAKNIELLAQQEDARNGNKLFIHFVKRVK